MFERFLVLIERPDLLEDKELLFQWDRSRRDDWPEIMGSWLREHDVDEIVERASELRIPVTPVYDGETIVNNEHLAERGVFVANPGGFTQPRRSFRIDEQDTPRPQPAPVIDADRDSITARPTPTPTEPDADPTALPLVGLRVLDLTAWWAGPSATNMLASLGAEVIHVEGTSHPDGVRMTGFLAGTDPWWEASHVFLGANTNKLGITLDLSSDEGRAIVEDLIRWADVVAENFSPRVMENWGLDRETVRAINPRAVFTRMPAFGTTGSWRDRVGFAQTMEQMTMASITGYPDDAPLIPKGPCDPIAGVHGAWAMLVALVQRERSGGDGVFVESTMIEAALNTCPLPLLEFSAYGEVMPRSANRSITSAPQGVYRCADRGDLAGCRCRDRRAMAGVDQRVGVARVGRRRRARDPPGAGGSARPDRRRARRLGVYPGGLGGSGAVVRCGGARGGLLGSESLGLPPATRGARPVRRGRPHSHRHTSDPWSAVPFRVRRPMDPDVRAHLRSRQSSGSRRPPWVRRRTLGPAHRCWSDR